MWGLFLYVLAWGVCIEIWGPYQGATRYIERPLYFLAPLVDGIETAGLALLGLLLWVIVFSLALLVLRLICSLLFDLPRKRR